MKIVRKSGFLCQSFKLKTPTNKNPVAKLNNLKAVWKAKVDVEMGGAQTQIYLRSQ